MAEGGAAANSGRGGWCAYLRKETLGSTQPVGWRRNVAGYERLHSRADMELDACYGLVDIALRPEASLGRPDETILAASRPRVLSASHPPW